MAKALRHVGIVVSDLSQAIKIYKDYLGCELVAEYPHVSGDYLSQLVGLSDAQVKIAILRTQDNNRLELLEYQQPAGDKHIPQANTIGLSHFAMTVADIQQLYDEGFDYEVEFISPPLKSPDGLVKVAYVILMQEHIVELVEVLDPRATYSGG